MSFAEFLSAVADAWSILAAYPWHWLLLVLVFLVVVESLMFIPYVGFVLKLSAAGIIVAQVIAIFASAAAGQDPYPTALLAGFSLPIASQLILAGAALLPFAAGTFFLYMKGGRKAIEFFYGNMFKTKPPSAELFEQFKYLMQAVALPFTFLAGAIVLRGLTGFDAISATFAAAAANWLPVVLLGLFAFAFEWCSAKLFILVPKMAAAIFSVILLVAYLTWTFALTYTVSAKVFATPVVGSV